MRVAIIAAALGYVLVVIGCFLAWHPLGFLAAGAGLFWAGLRKRQ